MTNPIETAVLPLKQDAMNRAETWAEEKILQVEKLLEENEWDLRKAAPYPSSIWATKEEYTRKLRRHNQIRALVSHKKSSLSLNDPDYVSMDDEKTKQYIKNMKILAAQQYDSFVAKLVLKIGETKIAVLEGNHVWGHSILTITKLDNSIERWKTQQIVNTSKLGLMFNQWPTRKMKN